MYDTKYFTAFADLEEHLALLVGGPRPARVVAEPVVVEGGGHGCRLVPQARQVQRGQVVPRAVRPHRLADHAARRRHHEALLRAAGGRALVGGGDTSLHSLLDVLSLLFVLDNQI